MAEPGFKKSKVVKVFIVDPNTGTKVAVESNGGLAVNIQDQHTRALDLKFIRALNSPPFYNLTQPMVVEDTVIYVDDTTLMVAGGVLVVVNPDGNFYRGGIVSFVSDTSVTVDVPVDTAMTVLNSSVIVATDELTSANGTLANPIVYTVAGAGAGTDVEIDITRIMGILQDDDLMDDSLFGGKAALTNGIVLRHNNGIITNLWNIKSNGDAALICFDANYHATGPAAKEYSFRFRNTYAGQDKHGVTLRLDPGGVLEILVQDTMLNESFKMMAQGHFVGN
jgi:hypothetical protein